MWGALFGFLLYAKNKIFIKLIKEENKANNIEKTQIINDNIKFSENKEENK